MKIEYSKIKKLMIVGVSRMGKSFFFKNVVLPALVSSKSVVILDRKGEYSVNMEDMPGNLNVKALKGYQEFFNAVKMGVKRKGVVYSVLCTNDVDYIYILNFLYALSGAVHIVLDEAHDIFLDKEFYQAKRYLTKLVRYGASAGIDFTLITQRFNDIPPSIRSQFLSLVCFKQNSLNDLKEISNTFGIDSKKILDLKPENFHYLES